MQAKQILSISIKHYCVRYLLQQTQDIRPFPRTYALCFCKVSAKCPECETKNDFAMSNNISTLHLDVLYLNMQKNNHVTSQFLNNI
jgi:hypothetical protein